MKHALALAVALVVGSADALAQTPASTTAPTAAPVAAPASPGVVNLNTATVEELQRLPGVGPAKAQAIVEARNQRAFRRPQDLLRVRGIGRATYRRLEPMLAVEGPTTLRER